MKSAYPISEEFAKELREVHETSEREKMGLPAFRKSVLERMAEYVGETEHAGLEGFEDSEDEILSRAEDLRCLTLPRDAFRESLLRFAAKFMADFARTL